MNYSVFIKMAMFVLAYLTLVEYDLTYVLEPAPLLIGGWDSLTSIITNSKQATQSSIEGTVFVPEVIATTGASYDLKVECGIDKIINESVLHTLGQMQFIPGKQRGRKVKARIYLPGEIK